jgi:uncharacterized protein
VADPAPSLPVERREVEHRFVVVIDGVEAELTYRLVGTRLVLIHDGVPAALEGRGVGSALVAAAVAWAAAQRLTVVPKCPFARHWLEANPVAAATVDVDWG